MIRNSLTRDRIAAGIAAAAAVAMVLTLAGIAAAQSGLHRPRDAVDIFVAATARGDADAIAALYAPDAILLAPNTPVIAGRDAIRAVFARNFSLGDNRIAFANVRVETGADRAAALWEWVSEIRRADGATDRMTGRSLVYFTLTQTGWLISADMLQQAPPR